MARLSLRLLATFLTTFSPVLVQAADCATWNQDMEWFLRLEESLIWSVRQQVCGNNACGNTQTCTIRGNSRYGGASLYRKDVQYEFPNCWDATENIITQCNRNWWQQGWWQLGDEFYQINVSPNSDLKRDLPSGNDGVEWTWEVEAYNITDS